VLDQQVEDGGIMQRSLQRHGDCECRLHDFYTALAGVG
jgi:hypothetical protein